MSSFGLRVSSSTALPVQDADAHCGEPAKPSQLPARAMVKRASPLASTQRNVLVQRTTVHWGPDNDNVEECFEHVADGDAACICLTSMIAFYRRPDIAWIPITEPGWV